MILIETSLMDMITTKDNKISKNLFNKVVIPHINELNQTIQRQAKEMMDLTIELREAKDKNKWLSDKYGELFQKYTLEIELLEKCVEFYGDESNWDGYGENQFVSEDSEDYIQENYCTHTGEPQPELVGNFGGKLARQTKQELEKLRGEK